MSAYQLKRFRGAKTNTQKQKILDGVVILEQLGIPLDQMYTPAQWRRVERLALVLLALGDVRSDTLWTELKSRDEDICTTTRGIITFINAHYSEQISAGSYDDFKRKEIDRLFIDSIVVSGSVKRSSTNDSRSGYAICPTHAEAIRKFGTVDWDNAVIDILKNKNSLRQQLDTTRALEMIPIQLPGHATGLSLTPGAHNELQKAIIEQFLPRYGYGCEVLYIGDSSDKYLYLNRERLLELNFPKPSHQELPDIITFSEQKKWIYLIEAVISFGQISHMRKLELKGLTENCGCPVVYITAFPNRTIYRKFCADLAWETEVWLASDADHLIHLDGHQFLGPYPE